MRETRRITIPAQNTKYEDKVFVKCNFCGVEARSYHHAGDAPEWPVKKSFEVNETSIFMKTGDSYPETGSGTFKELHVCPTCFAEKVIPALESLGVKFDEVDWEW
jgi:hypothetical protein